MRKNNLIVYMRKDTYFDNYAQVTMPRHGFDPDRGVWVVGDVHGCAETLKALMAQIPPGANVCFVGDLIDRGPKSKEVLEFVMANGWDCVLGNHESMLLAFLGRLDPPSFMLKAFKENGGMTTLESFGADPFGKCAIPENFIEWMYNLPLYINYPVVNEFGQELLVSHSSINSKLTLDGAAEDIWGPTGLLWNRGAFKVYSNRYYHIFGHTPQGILPKIRNHWACVDTGCVHMSPRKPNLGLTAIHFPSMVTVSQKNIDTQ